MKKAFVKINWVSTETGGKINAPHGKSYISVVKFPDQTEEEWKKEAWSIRLEFIPPEDDQGSSPVYAMASFLSEKAPHNKLLPNSTFEIFDGPHCMADVEVLLSEKLVEMLMAHAA